MKVKKFKRSIELQKDIDNYQDILSRIHNITNVKKATPLTISVRFDGDPRAVHINDNVLAETILDGYIDKLNNEIFDLTENFERL